MRLASTLVFIFSASAVLSACGSDSNDDGDQMLDGTLTTERTGALVHQDGPATTGTVSISRDSDNKRYLVLGSDFSSDFATGTVALFLAKSSANIKTQRMADAANVSARISLVNANGAQQFAIPANIDTSLYTHVVAYCETVEINFGAAALETIQLTTLRSGSLVAQDEPGTQGTVSIASDNVGKRHLLLGSNFASSFDTGTVSLFLAATNANLATQRSANAANVSVRIGRVDENGAHDFTIPDSVTDTAFSNVVVYCETVNVNFAAATIQ